MITLLSLDILSNISTDSAAAISVRVRFASGVSCHHLAETTLGEIETVALVRTAPNVCQVTRLGEVVYSLEDSSDKPHSLHNKVTRNCAAKLNKIIAALTSMTKSLR